MRYLIGFLACSMAVQASAQTLQSVRVSDDGTHFVVGETGQQFVVWGVNYDHNGSGELLDEYWIERWDEVTEDTTGTTARKTTRLVSATPNDAASAAAATEFGRVRASFMRQSMYSITSKPLLQARSLGVISVTKGLVPYGFGVIRSLKYPFLPAL